MNNSTNARIRFEDQAVRYAEKAAKYCRLAKQQPKGFRKCRFQTMAADNLTRSNDYLALSHDPENQEVAEKIQRDKLINNRQRFAWVLCDIERFDLALKLSEDQPLTLREFEEVIDQVQEVKPIPATAFEKVKAAVTSGEL